ncbi:Uncharacterised protein [Bordetella ansorpii]|uniref:Uncharacterized protein n=1 Tax=Bordetella ansorpii TaxID=288768 RepID=A0A157SJ56_9BORD|nr:hypothetical protein [Bordetella ansorpii]SAI70479.1 Uncharacterised protein [Bordetella ansorpii]
MIQVEYPFKTVTQAIVHALNDERRGGSPRPAASRLADARLADPPPFAGADLDAEKAMAERILSKELSRLHLAALRARYAPRQMRCCECNGQRPRLEWLAALREIANAAGQAMGQAGYADLRLALVQRHYEDNGERLETLAQRHHVSLSTVSRINSQVTPFLKGAKHGKNGALPLQGIDQAAYARAEDILRHAGFVE